MRYTDNYKLREPERGSNPDPADIEDLNYNAEVIDATMQGLEDDKAGRDELQAVQGEVSALETAVEGNTNDISELETALEATNAAVIEVGDRVGINTEDIETMRLDMADKIGTDAIEQEVTDDPEKIPSGAAVVEYVGQMGGGDMESATYVTGDKDNANPVDRALSSSFIKSVELSATDNIDKLDPGHYVYTGEGGKPSGTYPSYDMGAFALNVYGIGTQLTQDIIELDWYSPAVPTNNFTKFTRTAYGATFDGNYSYTPWAEETEPMGISYQSTGTMASGKIIYGTIQQDTTSGMLVDISTDKTTFTIKKSGWIRVEGTDAPNAGAGTATYLTLFKNNVQAEQAMNIIASARAMPLHVGRDFLCSVGDVFHIAMAGATTLAAPNYGTYICFMYLGA